MNRGERCGTISGVGRAGDSYFQLSPFTATIQHPDAAKTSLPEGFATPRVSRPPFNTLTRPKPAYQRDSLLREFHGHPHRTMTIPTPYSLDSRAGFCRRHTATAPSLSPPSSTFKYLPISVSASCPLGERMTRVP